MKCSVLSDYLYQTISYFGDKEDDYHAFLVGLFSGRKGMIVKFNDETVPGNRILL